MEGQARSKYRRHQPRRNDSTRYDQAVFMRRLLIQRYATTELASKWPERFATLVLTVTTPGGWPWSNLPPVSALHCLSNGYFKMYFPVEDMLDAGKVSRKFFYTAALKTGTIQALSRI